MSKPLLIGEAPSKAGDRYHAFPLSGPPAKRLCEFATIPPQTEGSKYGRYYWALLEHFDLLNSIKRYGDAYPWRVEVARRRVREYLVVNPAEVIVALGTRAFDAATDGRTALRGTPWNEWVEFGGVRVVMLPHPSGRNRLYNDPEMRRRAGRTLREAIGYSVLTDPDPQRRLAAERLQLGGRS